MNARQKAKYYKRKYEELKNMPLPNFTVTNYKVDTLRFERLITKETKEIFGNIVKSATSENYEGKKGCYDFEKNFDGDEITITFTNNRTVKIGNSEWGWIRENKE